MDQAVKKQKSWYVLYVNVRHEKAVAVQLEQNGITTYVPCIKQMKIWSDRKKMMESPLISGYVFVQLSPGEMDKPRYCQGVINYIRLMGKPAVIRDAEIEGLRYFVENGYVLEQTELQPLNVGDAVQFPMNDFKKFTARVESLVGDNFAIVSCDDVRMNFIIKAPIRSLKKATRN